MRSRGAALVVAALVFSGAMWVAPGAAAASGGQTVAVAAGGDVSADTALAQARRTGKAVEVTRETSPTQRVTTNPNGTLTLSQHAVPVRKRVGGVWKDLDATLRANADGTIAPAVTTSELTFSGGGDGPLATMRQAGRQLALALPWRLPKPDLSGATATYRDVLPGVDLRLTATPRGGFTQVFVVHNAAAARNPALAALTLRASGLAVTADGSGSLTASSADGKAWFTASPPVMWDSAFLPPGFKAAEASAGVGEARARSSAERPGARATVLPVGVSVERDAVRLTPHDALLSGGATVFPLYIDPTWTPVMPTTGAGAGSTWGYASVAQAFPTSNKWNNTADPSADNMQLGWADNPWHARTMINFPIDLAKLQNASITEAHIDATVVYSGSCSARVTRVLAPATTLSPSNATWNFWSGVSGPEVGSANFAGGYTSSCGPHAIIPPFPVLGGITGAVAAGRTMQTFVFTGATNEVGDTASYKELSLASIALAITYNNTPSVPDELTTSPQTPCTGTVGTVGDGDVLLYAHVTDPDGGTVGVRFEAWKSSVPGTLIATTDPANTPAGSGTRPVLTLGKSLLETQAGGAITEFSWRAQVWDGFATSGWSPTCRFNFDPTRPGAPFASPPPEGTTHIGQPVNIAVTRPAGGSAPARYVYQLNTSAPGSVNADANGNATITLTPARRTNTVTISSVSVGGNVGVDAAVIAFTTAPKTSVDEANDLTGDTRADLVTVGGVNGFASGVWLGRGLGTGQVNTLAGNIGVNGNGVVGDMKPSNFDGAQIVTGVFTGNGVQDVLAYYPATGAGSIIVGTGDGTTLLPQFSGNQFTVTADELRDEGTTPLQLANGADLIGNGDSSADLIGIGGIAGGYHLNYYFYASTQNPQGIINITAPTPAGDMAWDQWKIATWKTNMFLWQPSTGRLALWKNLDMTSGDLTFAAYQIAASGWNTGVSQALQASDIDGNGTPDLWAVRNNRVVTAYLGNGSTGLTAQASQTLSTTSHAWTLNDMPFGAGNGDTISAAADSALASPLPLNGSAGATWHTGDLYSPDASLNGTSGTLATTAAALATNADFSVSVWVKPTASGGVVLSQDGANTAAFKLHSDGSTNAWQFSLAWSDTVNPTQDTISAPANSVQIGVWTELTATYNGLSGAMNLAVNGTTVATGGHGFQVSSSGPFRVGAAKASSSTFGGYLAGQVARVQVWNHVVDLAAASRWLQSDVRADIVQNVGGTLYAYFNGGLAAGNAVKWDNPAGAGYTVATGLGTMPVYLADLNGDGARDLIRKEPDGTLKTQYYPWDGTGAWYVIGTGWTIPATAIYFADLNADHRADIVKKASNGNLEAYYNGGVNGAMGINWDQATTTTGYIIGSGWSMPDTSVYFADLSGTGTTDVVIKSGTSLIAYYNNGINGSKQVMWDYPYTIGTGWGMADTQLYWADINGDGCSDVTRVDTGSMNAYFNGGVNGSNTINWDYPPGGYQIRSSTPPSTLYIG